MAIFAVSCSEAVLRLLQPHCIWRMAFSRTIMSFYLNILTQNFPYSYLLRYSLFLRISSITFLRKLMGGSIHLPHQQPYTYNNSQWCGRCSAVGVFSKWGCFFLMLILEYWIITPIIQKLMFWIWADENSTFKYHGDWRWFNISCYLSWYNITGSPTQAENILPAFGSL